ncbi:MAG TPA: AAA family ATPase [Vicinamibacterales bacterium]|nr:AAA family ATPase [Vicinamibacterales bacterium]
MTSITKIARLKHPGVLRDFRWPDDLPVFGRFNLIYGWNGSGKTTLSRVFRALEQRVAWSHEEVKLVIDGEDVTGQDFPKTTLPVRVFNRDFVAESVFPVSGGEVPPIFVIGKDSVEKQKEADRLKGERTKAEASLADARAKKQDAERAFDKFCIERAKVIKDTLRSPGINRFNNYDKAIFHADAQKMAGETNPTSHLLDDAARETLLFQHRSTAKPQVSEVVFDFPFLQQLAERVSELVATTVVSAAIQSLKNDATLAEWTRHGLGLHKDRQSKRCLFCEQMLPDGRLAALEAHFSAEYEQFLQEIDEQVRQLQESVKVSGQLQLPNRAQLYDDLASHYDAAQQSFSQALSVFQEFVGALVRALNAKKGLPFTSQKLEVPVPTVAADLVERLNAVIRRHNQACDDFQQRTTDARERLARDSIAQSLDEYSRLAANAKAATDAIGPLEQRVSQLTTEIDDLEREIVEHRQPAEELNEDLRSYLGHGELRLEVKTTGYQLLRSGHLAEALSEGERTALALLYFLKSLGDRRFDLRNGVVVLDDPVSSLDAHALYLAFGFIRHRTQDAGQLFVLTHNFGFFRQVRNWFHHQKGQKKKDVNQRPARFYMLDRVHGSNPRCTTLRALDPLLEQYESEYHYLFACVHRAANATGETALEQNYGLPNVARRLLEMFMAFRRPQIAGELWQKLKDVTFDEAKKVRIARFVHTHSHGDAVGEPEHDPSLLGEARAVLTDLLELIRSEDAKHFDAMVGLVSGPAAEADSE